MSKILFNNELISETTSKILFFYDKLSEIQPLYLQNDIPYSLSFNDKLEYIANTKTKKGGYDEITYIQIDNLP